MNEIVSYEQIDPVLDELGWVWTDSRGERVWYRYAWGLLKPADTEGAVEADSMHYEAAIYAAALWAITNTFFAKAFDEGRANDWRYALPLIIGDKPMIDRSWLLRRLTNECQLTWEGDEAGFNDLDAVIDLYDEDGQDLLQRLIANVSAKISTQLQSTLGEAHLFASLWAARRSESEFPLSEATIANIFETAPLSMTDAYGWVSDGMPMH
ncbi:hypothetical protein FEK35_30220 [Nocardia cyriacigeorgica]|uniref:Uncharacterized protein n=1 Tax=Nocardia cyriacigeorgica TaxID=135487 RepID=A0A5R8P4Q3_9NOCA|nr:hypothetical protein [Nocardia cyriacigeorgica]TLF92924.1 hypothetical protein FEK35_30220 [Nocardia cyriacigeorgica]